MSYSLPQHIIDQIKESSDILQIISEHVNLRPSGSNYKGLCPFHQEKTSSFMVSPGKQIYKCFGCGEGGTSIHFVMKIRGLDFVGALEFLAQKAGMDLSSYQKRDYVQDSRYKRLKEMHRMAGEIYHAAVFQEGINHSVMSYLKQRDFGKEQIERYLLGYSPDSWDYLTIRLLRQGYTEQELIDGSLSIRSRKGNLIDYFRNRLIFPIFNSSGTNILGFGGRSLDGSDPKYLNSKDTLIYKKGEILYGLHLSIPHMMKQERCILVEGYTDFIALYEAGIRESVATLGTSLTEDQTNLIFSKCRKCVVFYDSDPAGIKAAARAVKMLVKKDMDILVANDPETGLDPDEMLKKFGKDKVVNLLDKGVNYFEFLADTFLREVKGSINEVGPRMIERLSEFYFDEKSSMKRREMLTILASKLSKPLDLLEEEIHRFDPEKDNHTVTKTVHAKKFVAGEVYLKAERGMLALLLGSDNKELKEKIFSNLEEEDFKNPENLEIYQTIVSFRLAEKWNHLDVIERIKNSKTLSYITGLMMAKLPDDEEQLLEGYLKRIMDRRIDERRNILKKRLSILENQGNMEEALQIANEINELNKLKKSII